MRAFGRPGRSESSGSTLKGSGSQSMSIFSIASSGGDLVDCGDSQNRLALVDRFIGERFLAKRARLDGLTEVGHDIGGRRNIARQ